MAQIAEQTGVSWTRKLGMWRGGGDGFFVWISDDLTPGK